jgi:GTPase
MEDIYDISLNFNLDQEKDDGNIEYKRELLNLDEDTINKRMTQMKYRIYEGLGGATSNIKLDIS